MSVQKEIFNLCLLPSHDSALRATAGTHSSNSAQKNQGFQKSAARELNCACQNVLGMMGKEVTLKQVLQLVFVEHR